MDLSLSKVNLHSSKVKDLIIVVLSKKSPLSAKKIFKILSDDFAIKFSYQAVHKSLQKLLKDDVLRKYDNEYYIDPEWIEYVNSFSAFLKREKSIEEIVPEGEISSVNFLDLDFNSHAVRFIPFFVQDTILKKLELVSDNDGKKVFKDDQNNLIYSFGNDVCVIKLEDKNSFVNPVDYLIHRRKVHNDIINSKKNLEHIDDFHGGELGVDYVMSIHFLDSKLSNFHFDNLMKLAAEPSILGIHDNLNQDVDDEKIRFAKSRVNEISNKKIDIDSILNLSLDSDIKILATWSNIVIGCANENIKENLKSQLVLIEAELQHFWFYMNSVKEDIRKLMKKNSVGEIKKLYAKAIEVSEGYHKFIHNDSTIDSQLLLIKDGIIKTSNIGKIYNELKNIIELCKLKYSF